MRAAREGVAWVGQVHRGPSAGRQSRAESQPEPSHALQGQAWVMNVPPPPHRAGRALPAARRGMLGLRTTLVSCSRFWH